LALNFFLQMNRVALEDYALADDDALADENALAVAAMGAMAMLCQADLRPPLQRRPLRRPFWMYD